MKISLKIFGKTSKNKKYIKVFALEYSKTQNQKINLKQQTLTKQILTEKLKILLDQNKTKIWQQELEDIENYKAQGTIIRSKEKIITNQEKPHKCFFLNKKNKNK